VAALSSVASLADSAIHVALKRLQRPATGERRQQARLTANQAPLASGSVVVAHLCGRLVEPNIPACDLSVSALAQCLIEASI
jgi:hypothetical protein